jgi:hypothetical protein
MLLRTEKLPDLYRNPSSFRVKKSRRETAASWTCRSDGETKMSYRILVGEMSRKYPDVVTMMWSGFKWNRRGFGSCCQRPGVGRITNSLTTHTAASTLKWVWTLICLCLGKDIRSINLLRSNYLIHSRSVNADVFSKAERRAPYVNTYSPVVTAPPLLPVKLCMLRLWVSYYSRCKQRLIPWIALTSWSQ